MLGEQWLLDKGTERAHADGFRAGAGDPAARRVVVDRLRLCQLDSQLEGRLGDRRWSESSTTPAWPVGPGDDELRAVRRGREPFEHRDRKLGRAQEDSPHGRLGLVSRVVGPAAPRDVTGGWIART